MKLLCINFECITKKITRLSCSKSVITYRNINKKEYCTNRDNTTEVN